MNREELRKHEQIWLDTIVEDQTAGPTSRLHDYAVGVVYDALRAGGDVRIQTEAGKSDNLLRDDVASVSMDETVEVGEGEGAKTFQVDIALADAAGKTIRVVEVCGWGMPAQPAHFMASMNREGIEVVKSTPLQSAADVAGLVVGSQGPPNFSGVQMPTWVEQEYGYGSSLSQKRYDSQVVDLIQSILYCHPSLRQQLRHLLDHLDSLKSLAPLSPNNPKREALNLDYGANSLERIVAGGKDAEPDQARPDWVADLHSGETYQAVRWQDVV